MPGASISHGHLVKSLSGHTDVFTSRSLCSDVTKEDGVLDIQLDRSSPVPLYYQLSAQLERAVDGGALAPGDQIENELALASRLRLSRPTVRRAIQELVAKGLLVRQRGVGTRVASRVVHRRVELSSLFDDLVRAGRAPRTTVLALDVDVHDARVCAALELDPDTPLVKVDRLRYAGDEPLALMRNWLPPRYADITRDELETAGMYTLLRRRGGRPTVARQQFGARAATAREAQLLATVRRAPLLTMSRRAFDAGGAAVEYGEHAYRSDTYTVDVLVIEQ
jgi:GntR family transcriptional regulator